MLEWIAMEMAWKHQVKKKNLNEKIMKRTQKYSSSQLEGEQNMKVSSYFAQE